MRQWRKRDDFAHPFTFPTSDEVAVLTSGVYDLEHPMTSTSRRKNGSMRRA